MERIPIDPRPDWVRIVTEQGLVYHSTEGRPYWEEEAFYSFNRSEIDALEKATYALNDMCLQAVEHVVRENLWHRFDIPPEFVPWIRESWEREERTIYGRFDLAFDGEEIRMLEYNADTPTALIEAAVIQWFWFKDRTAGNPELDQFNSIHERLIEAWQAIKADNPDGPVHFTSVPDYEASAEDFMTANYLRDTAQQAGLATEYVEIQEIGWNPYRGFVDLQERPIHRIFKLYPWEWLIREPFGRHLPEARTRWLEAPWKMLLSNKAILPILYRLFPESPYLLPADFEPLPGDFVRKPLLGREGSNTRIIRDGTVVAERGGPYDGPVVYQRYVPLPNRGNGYAIIGSWMVNGWACGIGIREDDHPITGNQCRFVPHLFG
ncbi:MAG: glutathionylspermidine synthase family protein [Capsulimonadales bacterium]|nr:glutathionylspermidine synthase family protein [Capsulimonadales bacterium]